MKLIGALVIVGASALYGALLSRDIKMKYNELSYFCDLLLELAQRIEINVDPLPVILMKLVSSEKYRSFSFLMPEQTMSEPLGAYLSASFLNSDKAKLISESDRASVCDAFRSLGGGDIGAECRTLRATEQLLRQGLLAKRAETDKRSKMYLTLFPLLGCAAVIILF